MYITFTGEICIRKLNCPSGTVECWKEINCGGDNELMQANIKISCLDKNRNELPAPPMDDLSLMDLIKECNDDQPIHEFREYKIEKINDQLEDLKEMFKDQIAGLLNGKLNDSFVLKIDKFVSKFSQKNEDEPRMSSG